jgi:hypothetical protein
MIPALFLTPLFKIGATAAVALVLVGSCALRDSSIRKQGEQTAVAKIEKANKNAVKKADEVGRKSRDPAARGLRDPNYSGD